MLRRFANSIPFIWGKRLSTTRLRQLGRLCCILICSSIDDYNVFASPYLVSKKHAPTLVQNKYTITLVLFAALLSTRYDRLSIVTTVQLDASIHFVVSLSSGGCSKTIAPAGSLTKCRVCGYLLEMLLTWSRAKEVAWSADRGLQVLCLPLEGEAPSPRAPAARERSEWERQNLMPGFR